MPAVKSNKKLKMRNIFKSLSRTGVRQKITEECLLSKAPQDWNLEETAFWLQCINLSQYSKCFIMNQIDGEILLQLEENDYAALSVSPTDKQTLSREISLLVNHTSKYSIDNSQIVLVQINIIRGNVVNNTFPMNVPRDILFDDFIEKIALQMKKKVDKCIEYKDDEGDSLKITKNSQFKILLNSLCKNTKNIVVNISLDK